MTQISSVHLTDIESWTLSRCGHIQISQCHTSTTQCLGNRRIGILSALCLLVGYGRNDKRHVYSACKYFTSALTTTDITAIPTEMCFRNHRSSAQTSNADEEPSEQKRKGGKRMISTRNRTLGYIDTHNKPNLLFSLRDRTVRLDNRGNAFSPYKMRASLTTAPPLPLHVPSCPRTVLYLEARGINVICIRP